jgi:hypothetical protein
MQEVVVGGWSPGEGRRAGGLGSLLLGVPDDAGRLVYAGHVGTGFSDRVLADLMGRLRKLEQANPPFADEVPRAGAGAGRRGRVLRVDPGRPDAPPDLAGPAAGQGAPRGRAGDVMRNLVPPGQPGVHSGDS